MSYRLIKQTGVISMITPLHKLTGRVILYMTIHSMVMYKKRRPRLMGSCVSIKCLLRNRQRAMQEDLLKLMCREWISVQVKRHQSGS